MINWYHPCLLVDSECSHNYHNNVRIDRALYKCSAALFKLENDMIAKINDIAKSMAAVVEAYNLGNKNND